MKLFNKQGLNHHTPELDALADKDLAERVPWVAFLMVPVAVMVAMVSDLMYLATRETLLLAGVFTLLSSIQYFIAKRFPKNYKQSPSRWRMKFYSIVILRVAVAGAIPPVVFFSYGTGWPFALCVLASTSMSAGSLAILSPRRTLMQSYITLAILPTILVLLIWGNNSDLGLSLFCILFLVQIIILGRHVHRQYWVGLKHRQLLKQRAAELQKANKQSKKTSKDLRDFLTTMSQEMLPPLNGIMGLADQALKSEDPVRLKQHLQDICNSGKTLVQTVSEIIDYSELENGKRQLNSAPFNLRSLVRQVGVAGELAGRSRGNTIAVHLDEELPNQVTGDIDSIRQILQNLIDNAVQNTELGKITLNAKLDHRQDGLAGFTVSVTDTGCGIAAEDQDKLFEAYHRTRSQSFTSPGNTGLGLTVSRQLAELMGGLITCESVLGQGSTFSLHLTLPEITIHKSLPADRDEAPHNDLTGLLVLVVEDNTVNAKLTTRLLEKSGMKHDWAQNGREAVEMFQKTTYDLVLMDIQMPVLDGLGATRAIRKWEAATGSQVPIIALTANATQEYREKCFAVGMNDFLTKPVQPKALRESLQHWAHQQITSP